VSRDWRRRTEVHPVGIVDEGAGQTLYRDLAAQLRIGGAVYDSHATFAELA